MAINTSHAAMVYTIGASSFIDREDMPAMSHTIDNDESLALYTFSGDNIPLVMNSNEHFDMSSVNVGLVVRTGGDYKLEFANLPSFGFDVVLVDKQQGYKLIDLKKTPEYTFTVTEPANSAGRIEVNSRFALRFTYTGHGVTITGVEDAPSPRLHVSSGRGYLQVWSGFDVSSLQIFDALGRLVYSNPGVNDKQLRVHVPDRQMYVVKAIINGEPQVEKTIVK